MMESFVDILEKMLDLDLDPHKVFLILVCFSCYWVFVFLFAFIYHGLYSKQHSTFFSIEKISLTRLGRLKESAQWSITRFETSINVLNDFSQYLSKSSAGVRLATDERGDTEATALLPDGRSLTYRHSSFVTPEGHEEDSSLLVIRDPERKILYESDFYGEPPETEKDLANLLKRRTLILQKLLDKDKGHAENLKQEDPTIWSFGDFLYFSFITQTTVGYGDMLPNSTVVRGVVMAQVLVAYLILIFVLNIVLSN